MKLKVIACDVLYREVCHACAESKHLTKAVFIPFGLHNTPSDLRLRLQEEIDATSADEFDAVALAYGLCSRGTADLTARSIPIILPKAHDCITLLLGSRAHYDEEFSNHPGTYYYSAGWIEKKQGEVRQGYITEAEEADRDARFREYVRKYGEDNARYLMEQEALWVANYTRTVFIDVGLGDVDSYRRFTQELAQSHGWAYDELRGDRRLIDKLIHGEWDDDFLRVEPGHTIAESFDSEIVRSVRRE